jgi:hypothetical protein
LKTHSEPLQASISLLFILFIAAFSSLCALTKFVPRSERNCITGPLMAKNRCQALMNVDVSRDSISSMWIALTVKQVKMTAQRLLHAVPPLVRRVITCHGPKTSTPTKMKGGAGVSRRTGRCCTCCPLNFLHLTQ